jgi:hypothetical protein
MLFSGCELTFKTSAIVIGSAAVLIQDESTAIYNDILELHVSRLGWPAEGDAGDGTRQGMVASCPETPDLFLDSR